MLVFWKARLVLLAVPKTGTQAWEEALLPHASMAVLDPPELKHAPVYRYNRFFRPMFEKMGGGDLELAAVIREPVSWLGSWYRYRQRGDLAGRPESTRGIGFDDFVTAWCSDGPPGFANVGRPSKFVEPRPNGTRVTHFFRYENQERLRDFLEDRLGVALNVPRRNVSPSAPLELSAETRDMLHRVRKAEFDLWSGIEP